MVKTTHITPVHPKRTRVKAILEHDSPKKHSGTVITERSEEGHIGDHIMKGIRKSRLSSMLKSLLISHEAASADVFTINSPISEDDFNGPGDVEL